MQPHDVSDDAHLSMPDRAMTTALNGRCHCGRVHAALEIMREASEYSPRACDCDFCRKHGAAWVSDPQGTLRIEARTIGDIRTYRQGSETADMLLCAHCGVLVAVIFRHRDGTFGAVNRACLEQAELGEPSIVSPQRLSATEKMDRWRALWSPVVLSPSLD